MTDSTEVKANIKLRFNNKAGIYSTQHMLITIAYHTLPYYIIFIPLYLLYL